MTRFLPLCALLLSWIVFFAIFWAMNFEPKWLPPLFIWSSITAYALCARRLGRSEKKRR